MIILMMDVWKEHASIRQLYIYIHPVNQSGGSVGLLKIAVSPRGFFHWSGLRRSPTLFLAFLKTASLKSLSWFVVGPPRLETLPGYPSPCDPANFQSWGLIFLRRFREKTGLRMDPACWRQWKIYGKTSQVMLFIILYNFPQTLTESHSLTSLEGSCSRSPEFVDPCGRPLFLASLLVTVGQLRWVHMDHGTLFQLMKGYVTYVLHLSALESRDLDCCKMTPGFSLFFLVHTRRKNISFSNRKNHGHLLRIYGFLD